VLPVKFNRRYRHETAANVIVTVFPLVGSNVCPADPTIVENEDPSLLPSTESVCVRAPQALDGGRSSTSREKLCAEPRSTCHHCGNALSVLSQYVLVLPSTALPGA
jgi:hypothetical protein